MSIKNRQPNAWGFSNSDPKLISPNRKLKIQYGEQYEIAMGAPLSAKCFIVNQNNEKTKISNWAGGPAIWNSKSTKVALPIWTKNREQRIRLIDISNEKIITFSKIFRVLELEKFENSKIIGKDSPIYKTRQLNFDIHKEMIATETKLK